MHFERSKALGCDNIDAGKTKEPSEIVLKHINKQPYSQNRNIHQQHISMNKKDVIDSLLKPNNNNLYSSLNWQQSNGCNNRPQRYLCQLNSKTNFTSRGNLTTAFMKRKQRERRNTIHKKPPAKTCPGIEEFKPKNVSSFKLITVKTLAEGIVESIGTSSITQGISTYTSCHNPCYFRLNSLATGRSSDCKRTRNFNKIQSSTQIAVASPAQEKLYSNKSKVTDPISIEPRIAVDRSVSENEHINARWLVQPKEFSCQEGRP